MVPFRLAMRLALNHRRARMWCVKRSADLHRHRLTPLRIYDLLHPSAQFSTLRLLCIVDNRQVMKRAADAAEGAMMFRWHRSMRR